MTHNQFEGVNVYWVPEINNNPIDLTDAMKLVRDAADDVGINASWSSVTLGEVIRADDVPEPVRLPEETLTEVYNRDGYLIAYVEAFHGDGVDTIKFYEATHPPGAPRMVLPADLHDEEQP